MREAQPNDEHPMKAEWDEIKERAREQGLLHNDGTFANPPQSGGALHGQPTSDIDWRKILIKGYMHI